jgi:hypothetical protein
MLLAMSKKALFRISGLAALVVLIALVLYSHARLLDAERRFMPPMSSLATHHEREVSFRLFAPWGPHWRVVYRESPVTDTEYIDPALSVDLFGRVADTESKEVWSAVAEAKFQGK